MRHVSTHLRHVSTHLHHVPVCATVSATCQVGNFRVEPPGLFRGRGEHPKMGMLKARVMPEDVTINISKGAPLPPVPDMGDGKKHKWGEVRHVHVFWRWRCCRYTTCVPVV